jgi:hypothetical protein
MTTPDDTTLTPEELDQIDKYVEQQLAQQAEAASEAAAAEAAWHAYVDYMESLQDSLGYEDHDRELPW